MPEFDFTLILQEPVDLDEVTAEKIYSKCNDCTVGSRAGSVFVEFDREGQDLERAVVSAIHDLSSIGLIVRRVDACGLVTQSEIARRAKLTRQAINNYATGRRGKNFPTPVCQIEDDHAPLWSWCEVSHWLVQNQLAEPELMNEAFVLDIINSKLEQRFLKRVEPVLLERINRLLEDCESCS